MYSTFSFQNFIIRQSCLQTSSSSSSSSSSKAVSALSVKLSEREVRHYLVLQQTDTDLDKEEIPKGKKNEGKVYLEESKHLFDNVLAMVFHYSRDNRYRRLTCEGPFSLSEDPMRYQTHSFCQVVRSVNEP